MPKSNRATVSNAGPIEEEHVVRATGEVVPVNPGTIEPDPEPDPAPAEPEDKPKRSARR